MNEIKLKSCPFCGCPATLQHTGTGENLLTFVECDGCGARTAPEYASFAQAEERVTEAWNERFVKHGKWIYRDCVCSHDGLKSGFSCSECNGFVDEEIFDMDEFNKGFCGNCGAKMDESSAFGSM